METNHTFKTLRGYLRVNLNITDVISSVSENEHTFTFLATTTLTVLIQRQYPHIRLH